MATTHVIPGAPDDFMSDAPDVTFEEAFANQADTPPQPQAGQTSGATTTIFEDQLQATAGPGFELKTNTGTVYKSAEEAIRGIEQKDTLLGQLRQQIVQLTGQDPLSARQAAAPGQVAPAHMGNPNSLVENPQLLWTRMSETMQRGDAKAWAQTLGSYVDEILQRRLAPYNPIIGEVSKTQAVRALGNKTPEYGQELPKFIDSAEYQTLVSRFPVVKEALQIAVSDPQQAGVLPELFELLFLADRGLKLDAAVKAAAARPTASPNPNLARPTLNPRAAISAPTGRPQAPNSLNSEVGRDAIIANAENSGLLDIPIDQLR